MNYEDFKRFMENHPQGKTIRFSRIFSKENLYGIATRFSKSLFGVINIRDFQYNGCSILKIDHISNIEHTIEDDFITNIIKEQNIELFDFSIFFSDICMDSIASALSSLARLGFVVIVEGEKVNKANDTFYIGRPSQVNDFSCSFYCIDTCGNWISNPDIILHKNITRIDFKSPYSIAFEKYLQRQNSQMNDANH